MTKVMSKMLMALAPYGQAQMYCFDCEMDFVIGCGTGHRANLFLKI